MKNGIDKFLTSDKVLYSLPWIYTISILAFEIFNIVSGVNIDVFELGLAIISIFIVLGIAISYKAHEKNIMKTLFGALIMGKIIFAFNFTSCHCSDPDYTYAIVVTAVLFLLYVVLFINHLVLGYGHNASPDRVKLNRAVGILIIISVVVPCIPYFTSAELTVSNILGIVAELAMVLEILCIETKVDAYKIIRENK